MNQPVEIFLGFDPGGRRNFGWSVCKADSARLQLIKTGTADNAAAVINQILEELPSNSCVSAVGIDAPMFWNITGEERNVDAIIRNAARRAAEIHSNMKHPGRKSPGVQQINSLRGACLVQGILIGDYLYQQFKAPITEVHPGALSWLKPARFNYIWTLTEGEGKSDHERDATLAAYAAWCMHENAPGWRDLFLGEEPNSFRPLGPETPVHYWMPIP